MEPYTIDAKGKILGRVATEAAHLLRGKNSAAFEPYKAPQTKVKIIHASAIRLSGSSKADTKVYKRFSGYPSGLKQTTYAELIEKSPARVVEHAIRGMLPKNKLCRKILRDNLIIEA